MSFDFCACIASVMHRTCYFARIITAYVGIAKLLPLRVIRLTLNLIISDGVHHINLVKYHDPLIHLTKSLCIFLQRRSAKLAIYQLRTAKHLWIVWRDNEKYPKTLRVKIGAQYSECTIGSLSSKKCPLCLSSLLAAISQFRVFIG